MNCPKCNDDNIRCQVKRRMWFSTFLKSNKYKTVAVCRNCGYAWNINDSHGWLYGIMALCLWPFFVSVWFYKTPLIKINKIFKTIILAIVWMVILICMK